MREILKSGKSVAQAFRYARCPPRLGRSEAQDETDPRSTRHRRMKVDVVYTANRFAGQARGVVVIDVAPRGVENIEHIDGEPDTPSYFVTGFDVHERRGVRARDVIRRQRSRTEVSQ